MTSDAVRKRNPEALRERLLQAAAAIAVEQGIQAVTIQAVAQAAGVTKGGLFHHFASKDDLIQAVITHQLSAFDEIIDSALLTDSDRGCFTRAYVAAIFALSEATAPVSITLMAEQGAGQQWGDWISARLEQHQLTDAGSDLTVVRLAADGVWLWDLWNGKPVELVGAERLALYNHLIDATRRETSR